MNRSVFLVFALLLPPSLPGFAADVSQETPDGLNLRAISRQQASHAPLTKKPADDSVLQQHLSDEDAEEIHSNHQIFGNRGGYVHASLGVDFEYTDNLYNVDHEKQDNWLTQVAPAFWITLPRRARIPLHVAPHNTSPGGIQFSQPDNYFFNAYQLYLGAGLNFKDYSENSSLNATDAYLEGLLQYNVTHDITVALMDRFTRDQDMFNLTNATSNNQRVFHSNIFTPGIDWQISEKLSAKFDYNFFTLSYDDDVNRFFDRNDNGFDISAFYDYSLKTNFFLQYRVLTSSFDDHDQDTVDLDNTSSSFYAGLNWKPTVKTSLLGKLGYQQVEYDSLDDGNSTGAFAFELQANWQATIKTSVIIDALYNIEQTDSYGAINKKVFVGRIGYYQLLSERLRGKVDFIYENSKYDEFDKSRRVDDRLFFKPELQYAFRRWLTGSVSYTFDTRESNKEYLDYETNMFKFGVKVSF